MKIGILHVKFHQDIKKKKKFLTDLIKYTDIDLKLMRRAIHHMRHAPYECHEDFFKTPIIDDLKKNNPAEYKKVISVRKALSALMNNSVINTKEKDSLKMIADRITKDYGIDMADRKALLDGGRAETNINKIEDYKNYSDNTFGWEIDKHLKTDKQCEGKLITMLYNYLMPLAVKVNSKKIIGHQRDYRQKDVYELIAEILNLRWMGKYNYEKIRTIYRNFQTVKQ